MQGFKRLKKLQPEVHCKQLTSYEWCPTADHDQIRHGHSNSADSKEASVGGDKPPTARRIPISIKFKRKESVVVSNHGETDRDRIHVNELGKTMREPRQTEIGPRRLKIRGPSVLGHKERLD